MISKAGQNNSTQNNVVPLHPTGDKGQSSLDEISPAVSGRPKTETAVSLKAAAIKDTTLSCRYELKYRISEAKARAIAHYLKPYMKLDRYAQLRPHGEYPITSLYLDSDDLTLCKETLYKKKNRFKLRIRGYSDKPDTPIFFEVKRRINTVIMKSRARAMHHHVRPIMEGRDLGPVTFKTDMKALRQFQLYVSYINARPMVLVRYMRQAFEGEGNNRVRITFDRKLCYKTTNEPKVELNGIGWQRVPIDFVILEIKFTARYPAWLSGLTKAFNLQQTAMSKYASSVRQSCVHGFSAPQYSQFYELLD